MVIRVINSKGKKDRLTLLSETVLIELRNYYKIYRPNKWLFESPSKGPYSPTSISNILKKASIKAKLPIKVSPHILRHSLASHLLENGRKSYKVKHYKTKACAECRLRNECTTNKLGRFIERTEYAEFVEDNNNRVQVNPAYYRQRQQIIEHQFGTQKRHWHFDYVLTKGKEKVMGEVYLAFTTYNLRRLISIFDFETLMCKMKAHFKAVFLYYRSFFKPIRTYLKEFNNTKAVKANFIEITTFSKIKTGLLHELPLGATRGNQKTNE